MPTKKNLKKKLKKIGGQIFYRSKIFEFLNYHKKKVISLYDVKANSLHQ